MNQYNYFVDENLLPSRLDKILTHLSGFSRSKVQQMIKSGEVLVSGNVVTDSNFPLKNECEIKITAITKEETKHLTPKEMDLDIVFEDDHLLVLNKQAGLTVHPGAGNHDDTLVNALLFYCQNKLSSVNGNDRPGIVHRLDRDTTGLMVVAKSDIAHQNLASQIENKTAGRSYIALVWGMLKTMTGTIDINIGRSNRDRTKMTALQHGGKTATTIYTCKEILANGLFSLVECELKTGRTHQIRVHMSHIGHSIVGDQTYGTNDKKIRQIIDPELKRLVSSFKRQALHAYKLSFDHPITNERMEFEAPLADDMNQLIDSVRVIR